MSGSAQASARHLTFDVAIQIGARVLNLIIGIFVTLILVRGLGSHNFGIWSTIFAVGQLASSFGDLGLNQIAVSRAAAEPQHEPSWLGALLSLRMTLAIPIALGTLAAVLLIAPNAQARIAGALITCVGLVMAPATLAVVFQLRVRNAVSMAIMTFNSLLWGAAVVLVAATVNSITAFAAAFLCTSAITSAVTVAVTLRMASVRMDGARRLWRQLLRVGVGLGVAGVLVTAYVRLDQILVLEFAGSREAGLYGADYRLLDQIQFIPLSVMTTLFPLIAAAYPGRRERVQDLLQSAAEYLAMASFAILAFTIVAARPIITLLFTGEFAAAAPALPILAGAFVSISFGYLVGNLVVILELQRRFASYAAIGLFLNATLNVVLIPRYGFLAAAWITLLTEVTVMSLSMRSVLRALEMRPRFGRLGRILVAACLLGLLTWTAKMAGLPLGALVALAAAGYLPVLVLMRALVPSELRALLRQRSSGAPR